MPLQYPFSAVVGCDLTSPTGLEPMGLALVLTSISPEIGGVLVRGEKGTAKSTTVRSLADVLPEIDVHPGDRYSVDPHDPAAVSPDGPFEASEPVRRPVRLVELPVGATEDRVLGSIQLEKALTAGEVEFEPGLLARAHRGILYVDEVNLLHDHLVDLLLDAAATGRVAIERDGISVGHGARFVLVGTMNPEEGELRPQLLDRFGLTVEVSASRDPRRRVEVIRRRLAFDHDPLGFGEQFSEAQITLTRRIEQARALVPMVQIGDVALLKIAEVCAAFEVDGLRADIVTARTAAAHAAWDGRTDVTRADIRAAALLSLPHRRRRNPFDAPGLDEDLLDQILGEDELPDPPEDRPTPDDDPGADDPAGDDGPADGESQEGAVGPSQPSDASALETTDDAPPAPQTTSGDATSRRRTEQARTPFQPRLFSVQGLGDGGPGRRSRSLGVRGRRIGSHGIDGDRRGSSLHLVETLRAAAERHAADWSATGPGRFTLDLADLRVAVREGREANLLVFCVDASGSMAARRRMAQVKTAVLSLLTDAYRRRDKVALVSFRGHEAEVTLPPTGSIDVAAALLDDLPAGGRTPLAEGLLEAHDLVQRERRRDRSVRPLLMLVTDGRATAGDDAVGRSRQAAELLAARGVASVVVDCEDGPLRMGLARTLAAHLRAEHVPMAEVSATGLVDIVTGRAA